MSLLTEPWGLCVPSAMTCRAYGASISFATEDDESCERDIELRPQRHVYSFVVEAQWSFIGAMLGSMINDPSSFILRSSPSDR